MESTQTVMGKSSRTRMPPTHIEGPVVVVAASAKGFRMALTLEKITVEDGPGLQKGTTATLQRSWNTILGARVRMRLTAQGELREAVGQGAVWRTRSQSETGGAALVSETAWHLESGPSEPWTLRFETQHRAADGAAFSPGPIPRGMTVKLEGLSGEGKGRAKVRAERPIPIRLRGESNLVLKLSGRVASRAFTLSTAERTRVVFSSP